MTWHTLTTIIKIMLVIIYRSARDPRCRLSSVSFYEAWILFGLNLFQGWTWVVSDTNTYNYTELCYLLNYQPCQRVSVLFGVRVCPHQFLRKLTKWHINHRTRVDNKLQDSWGNSSSSSPHLSPFSENLSLISLTSSLASSTLETRTSPIHKFFHCSKSRDPTFTNHVHSIIESIFKLPNLAQRIN